MSRVGSFWHKQFLKAVCHTELDDSSRLRTPPEMEPVMDCSLVLTEDPIWDRPQQGWHTPLSSRIAVQF